MSKRTAEKRRRIRKIMARHGRAPWAVRHDQGLAARAAAIKPEIGEIRQVAEQPKGFWKRITGGAE